MAVNVTVLVALLNFRDGDSNMGSVWVCSRNDTIGNVTVILAGVAVYFFRSKYPDLIVAFVLTFLALQAPREIISRAWGELSVGEMSATTNNLTLHDVLSLLPKISIL
ncbi:hypothetical protein [Moraxella equi]|uniref:Uncharacterized protein n=1 Tax=Moraxella equi TaxID=60442 RepID=A0A378QMU2_9GAMM|nr:hypothetical protein [Moraxella equi]STZ02098.1 Uncharacterised protein [Moraxella equi]